MSERRKEKKRKKKQRREDQATEEDTANFQTEKPSEGEEQIPQCAPDKVLEVDTLGDRDKLGFIGETSKKHKRKKKKKKLSRDMDGTHEIRSEDEFCDLGTTSPSSLCDNETIKEESSEPHHRDKKKKKKSSRHTGTGHLLEPSESKSTEAQEWCDSKITSPNCQTDTAAINQESPEFYQRKTKKKKKSSRHESSNQGVCTGHLLELSEGTGKGNKAQALWDSEITSRNRQTNTAATNQESCELDQRKKKKKKKSSRHESSNQEVGTGHLLELSESTESKSNAAQEWCNSEITSPSSQTNTVALNQESLEPYQKKPKKKKKSSRHENVNEDIRAENSLELSVIGNEGRDLCDSSIVLPTSQACVMTDEQEFSELYQKNKKKTKKKRTSRHKKSQVVCTETSLKPYVGDELQELSASGDILSTFQNDSEIVECSELHKTKKKRKKKKKKMHSEDTDSFVSKENAHIQEGTEDAHVQNELNLESESEERNTHCTENQLAASRSSGGFPIKSKRKKKKRKKEDISSEEENPRKKRKSKSDTSDDLEELMRRVCSNIDSTALKNNTQRKKVRLMDSNDSGSGQLETDNKIEGLENIGNSEPASPGVARQVKVSKRKAESELEQTVCLEKMSPRLDNVAQMENIRMDSDSSDRQHSTGSQDKSADDKMQSKDSNVPDYLVFNTIHYLDFAKLRDEHARRGDNIFKFGRWKKLEKQRLEQNWEQFLKEHEVKEEDIDTLFRQYTKRKMTKEKKSAQKQFLEDTALYTRLAEGLNRPLYSVYFESRRRFGNKKTAKLTLKEEHQLKKLHKEHQGDWKKMAEMMGRTPQALKLWWEKQREKAARRKIGQWSQEEEDLLIEAIKEDTGAKEISGDLVPVHWAAISEKLPTRHREDCYGYWYRKLQPRLQGKPLSIYRDITYTIQLFECIKGMGVTDQTEVDWNEVKDAMGGIPKFVLHTKWGTWKRKIPEYKNKLFPEILEYMERVFLPRWKRSAGYSCKASTTNTSLPTAVYPEFTPWLQKQKVCVGANLRWPVKLSTR